MLNRSNQNWEHKQERNDTETFVKVHKPQFWDLFICPAYKGLKLQVLAWVAYHSWGEPDWDNLVNGKPQNRRFTKEPIDYKIVARDIGAHPAKVCAAIKRLRNDGILIRDSRGCEGIDKYQLRAKPRCNHFLGQKATIREIAALNQSVNVNQTVNIDQTVTDFNQTVTDCDRTVNENPSNDKTDKRFVAPQTIQTIQTKKHGAHSVRTDQQQSDHQAIVSWWIAAFKEQYGNQYLWNAKDGKLLKGLLQRLASWAQPVEEILRRARYCLDHAGDAQTALRHLHPPVTFPDFVANWDRCLMVASTTARGECDAAAYFAAVDREVNDG